MKIWFGWPLRRLPAWWLPHPPRSISFSLPSFPCSFPLSLSLFYFGDLYVTTPFSPFPTQILRFSSILYSDLRCQRMGVADFFSKLAGSWTNWWDWGFAVVSKLDSLGFVVLEVLLFLVLCGCCFWWFQGLLLVVRRGSVVIVESDLSCFSQWIIRVLVLLWLSNVFLLFGVSLVVSDSLTLLSKSLCFGCYLKLLSGLLVFGFCCSLLVMPLNVERGLCFVMIFWSLDLVIASRSQIESPYWWLMCAWSASLGFGGVCF